VGLGGDTLEPNCRDGVGTGESPIRVKGPVLLSTTDGPTTFEVGPSESSGDRDERQLESPCPIEDARKEAHSDTALEGSTGRSDA
jgi:hypothetical protein